MFGDNHLSPSGKIIVALYCHENQGSLDGAIVSLLAGQDDGRHQRGASWSHRSTYRAAAHWSLAGRHSAEVIQIVVALTRNRRFPRGKLDTE